MTGFGSGRAEHAGEVVFVEVRSVNGKFCEVKTRLPRELAALDAELVKLVKARVQRGMIDVFLRREGVGARGASPRIDLPLAAAYAKAMREMGRELGLAGEPTVTDIAGLEGVVVLGEAAPDPAAISEAARAALSAALDGLDRMRRSEGAALEADLRARLEAVERGAAAVRELAPATVEGYRDRLAARVAELSRGMAVDPARLAQEVALFADRIDISEELTRLASHLAQLRAMLGGDAPAGRRLEFLVQEANREINTVGSKSQHAGIAAQVVEMKADLERIREQVQNVE